MREYYLDNPKHSCFEGDTMGNEKEVVGYE